MNNSASKVYLYFHTTQHLHSLVSAFLHLPMYGTCYIACSCHPIGSLEDCCDPRGGQCPCRSPDGTNIQPYGLTCNTCPSLYYGPTNAGCIGAYYLTDCTLSSLSVECNCISNADQCDVNTGQCPCPPLVGGRQCTECVPNTFGDPAVRCFPCACDATGTEVCNSTNGDCVCTQYYTGETCDRCSYDAFNDSLAGCSPCECDPVGSANQSCSTTGKCSCKVMCSITDILGRLALYISVISSWTEVYIL